MEKKLPKVFANPQEKNFNNNKKIYYSKENSGNYVEGFKSNNDNNLLRNTDSKNIYQKLNDIFTSEKYVYKADVDITTKKGKITTKIIGQNRSHIITMDNELIPSTDIEDIKFSK